MGTAGAYVFYKDIFFGKCFQKPSVNPLPDDKILDWSKLKQIANDILKSI